MNRGSPIVVDARYDSTRRNSNNEVSETRQTSEIFSDLHLAVLKSTMIIEYLWPHSMQVRDKYLRPWDNKRWCSGSRQ